MIALLQALRDLRYSVTEHPAEWSDNHLAEVSSLTAAIRGSVETERLYRATSTDFAEDHRPEMTD